MVCLRRCAWLQGKVKRGGSVSNFVEKLRERGKRGLWPHSGFSVLNLVENPERNDTGWRFTWLTSCYCSAFEIFLKPHKEYFPDLKTWGLEHFETTTPVTGLQVQTARPQYPFVFPPGTRAFKTGCRVGVLSWFFVRVLGPRDPFALISKGNHIGRHRYHPLPVWVLMSQVLLVQPRTEDGQGGGVLHLRLPSHCPILVPGGLQIYSSSTLLCFGELHSKCCVKEGFQDKGTMKKYNLLGFGQISPSFSRMLWQCCLY